MAKIGLHVFKGRGVHLCVSVKNRILRVEDAKEGSKGKCKPR